MLYKEFSRFYRQWVNRIRREKLFRVTRRQGVRLKLDEVETRLAPAVLPQPSVVRDGAAFTITNKAQIPTSLHSVQVAVDPTNNQRQVAFAIGDLGMVGLSSTNAGASWTSFYNTGKNAAGNPFFGRLQDPTQNEDNGVSEATRLDAVTPSVAYDRNGNIYVVHIERQNSAAIDGTGGPGVVVFDSFSFSSGTTPTPQVTQQVLYSWGSNGHDPAFNPSVAVNNNTKSTDPISGLIRDDLAAGKAVYVTWNTNGSPGQLPNAGSSFNANVAWVAAAQDFASDPQMTFTSPIRISNSYLSDPTNVRVSDPKIVFAQPPLQVAGVSQPADVNYFTTQADGGRLFRNISTPSQLGSNKLPIVAKNFPLTTGFFINDSGDGTKGATTKITFDLSTLDDDLGSLSATDVVTDLDFGLALSHLRLTELSATLTNPVGTKVTLFNNQTFPGGTAGNYGSGLRVGLAGADLGIGAHGTSFGSVVSTTSYGAVFSDQAARNINDSGSAAPYNGYFRVESGSFGGGNAMKTLYDGFTLAQLAGTWTLTLTDAVGQAPTSPPETPQVVTAANIRLSFGAPVAGTKVEIVTPTPASPLVPAFPGNNTRGFAEQFATANGVSTIGIGGYSVAVDSTPVAQDGTGKPLNGLPTGNIYVAYSSGTNIRVLSIADGNLFPADTGLVVNDDGLADHFTEGNGVQFMPTIAVDQQTGTVAVSWFDSRYDASDTRIANYVATSIDGGNSFSSQTVSYLDADASDQNTAIGLQQRPYFNAPKRAVDAITGKFLDIEPIPANMANAATVHGFGTRQSLYFNNGELYSYWSGNLNAAGTLAFGAKAVTAVGPRVVDNAPGTLSDQGAITGAAFAGYNGIGADGTPFISAFKVVFDRPVDPATFKAADVTMTFTAPNGVQSPIALGDPVSIDPTTNTMFLVPLAAPSSKVGTYSYTVGPNVLDRTSSTVTTFVPVVPTPPFDAPFVSTDVPTVFLDFQTKTSKITVPALPPGQFVAGATVKVDSVTHPFVGVISLTLISPQGTRIDLSSFNGGGGTSYTNTVFDDTVPMAITAGASPFTGSFRPESPLSFLNGEDPAGDWLLELTDVDAFGDVGTLTGWSLTLAVGTATVVTLPGNAMDQNANAVSAETTDIYNSNRVNGTVIDRIPLSIPGPYYVGASLAGGIVPTAFTTGGDTLNLNSGSKSVVVYFDRDIQPSTFTAASILRMTGPFGNIAGPFTVAPNAPGVTPGTFRSFTVGFPAQVVDGNYSIEFAPTPVDSNGIAFDNNKNAAIGVTLGGDPLSPSTVVNSYNSVPGSVVIQPNRTVTMDLNVLENFQIFQNLSLPNSPRIQVQINVAHSNVPDLQGVLIAPDGTRIQLFNNVGTVGQPPRSNFLNTTFQDNGATLISLGAAPFNLGTFIPQQALGTLANRFSQGRWQLEITNQAGIAGAINNWSLSLPTTIPGTGLAEPVSDRFSVGFRLFTQDPSNPLTQQQWTPVGPATISGHEGRISGVTVDPSDPSGNTVYLASASGGIWKTTNFNTSDAVGPNWLPLTDFGPTAAMNTSTIALFPRNNDPNQTIVFALTGEGNVGSGGVGVLRSMDGGKTWKILDSTNNVDASNNVLPIDSPARDHRFVGSAGFKIITDPNLTPTGEVIVYMAISGGSAPGVYRSINTGRTWTRIQAGNATDVVLAAGSIPRSGPSRNAEILYAAIRGQGVFVAFSAPSAGSMALMTGGIGNPNVRTVVGANDVEVTVTAGATPNGGKGRITLAAPVLEDTDLENSFYRGWLYAFVATAGGSADGLYVTKDFGANWTKVNIPRFTPANAPPTAQFGTNDETRPQKDVTVFPGGALGGQANYDLSLAVDPVDPNIVYIAGLSVSGGAGGSIRLDLHTLSDAQALHYYDNSDPGAGSTIQTNTQTGGATVRIQAGQPNFVAPGYVFGINGPNYVNFSRDPDSPFDTDATIFVSNSVSFVNDGADIKWAPFLDFLSTADIHQIVTYRDPYTRQTRLIYVGDQSIDTGVARADGSTQTSIGFTQFPSANRVGNLQITQFYAGAAQPSTLAADIAKAMFYGGAQDNGSPASAGNVLQTGNIVWVNAAGDASGVATDQTGSGTAYVYQWPCCGPANATDFFRVDFAPADGAFGIGRTQGLLRQGIDDPINNKGQWPLIDASIGYMAINPIDKNGAMLGSAEGRLYRSTTLADTAVGAQWFVTATPGDLDGSVPGALAFGAPDPANPGQVNNFLYAGTDGGNIFVTNTGGAPWTKASTGLSGGQIETIKPNPRFGSKDAFAVTNGGVFYNTNPLGGASWVNITGNLFKLTKPIFDESGTTFYPTLRNINALEVDWRYAIPDTPGSTSGPTHPVLYVGGDGGVFRSRDKGATWTYFPEISADGAAADGGYLPNVEVTDLDLSLGNIDPATGLPNQGLGGLNFLLATTYGRGSFGIRLNNRIDEAFNVQFESGPFVTTVANPNPVNGPSTLLKISFDQAVDPVTLSLADVKIQRPDGTVVPITSVTPVNDGSFKNYTITFMNPETVVGFYRLSVGENDAVTGRPALSDFAGNLMNQNQNSLNGEALNDNFIRYVFLNGASANSLVADGLPAEIIAGTPATFTVTIQDPTGAPVVGSTDTVTFTFTDPSVTLPDYTFTPADMGSHAFTVTFTKAGLQSVIVNPVSPSILNPGKDETLVKNAPASQIFVTGHPSPSVAGVTQNFTVTVADPFGNTAVDYTGVVAFTSSDKNPQTVLPLGYQFTSGVGLDNGVHVFQATLTKAGLQSITATDTVTPTITGTQSNILITHNVVNSLALAGYPSPAKAGTGGNVTVTAIDLYGNTVLNYTGTIRFTSTDVKPSTVLPPNYTYIPANMGVISLGANLTTTGVQTIIATDVGNTAVTGQADFVVTPGAATSYTIAGFPDPTTAGVDGKFTVTVFDAFGNVATDYLGTARFTSIDAQAGLPSDYTFTGVDMGVVTLTGNLKTAGLQTITATDITNASLTGTQANILVNPADASSLGITGFPTPTIAGVDQSYVVTAFDPFGNVATGYAGTITLTSSDPQAQLPPTTYTFSASDAGIHTFTGNLRTAGTFSITATDKATSSITGAQNGIVVLPAAAKTLTVAGFPSPTVAGVDGSITVTAQDAFGNIATGYTGTVMFSSSDGQAGLPTNFTFTGADAGVHSFNGSLKTAGIQSITATDTVDGTILGSQGGIQVNPAAASILAVSKHTTPINAGSSGSFTVTAFDPFGNIATGYTGSVKFLSTDPQATLPGETTFTATDKGVRTFTDILRTAGSRTVTAVDTLTPTIAGSQSNIQVLAIAPASLSILDFPSPTTAGVVQSYTVVAKDKFGNPTPLYTGTVSFTSGDKLAGLPSNYTFTAGDNGTHSFVGTLKTAGTQSITVTDTKTSSFTATQTGIKVVAADAAKMFITNLPASSVAGANNIVQVSFKDVFGNIATGYTGTVRFTSTDNNAGLPSDYTFTSTDQGVHNFTVQLKTAGTHTLTVVDTANPSLAQSQSGLVVSPAGTTKLAISGLPPTAKAGVPTTFTVTATDNFGNVDTTYNGIVTFSSSDSRATVPQNVAFLPTELGKKTFTVTFGTPLVTSSITAKDVTFSNLTGTATTNVLQNFSTVTNLTGARQFAVGTESRSTLPVRYYDSNGNFIFDVFPFQSAEVNGGGRVSTANFNGDGRDEIVVSSSPGMAPSVVVIDGFTEKRVLSIDAFESSFTGGVYVSTGDINGDGVSDLAVSPDEGGGPRVRLFDGKALMAGQEVLIADFFGIDDKDFRGGARAAVGDLNGDGFGDLVVAAGFGGGPRVAAYDGQALSQGKFVKLFNDFFAFEDKLRNGVYIAAGDIDGDGKADLVAGGGPGGGPRVSVLSGNEIIQGRLNRIADFFAGNEDNRGGVRVAVKDLDNDNRADIVVGSGVNAGNRVTSYLGKNVIGVANPAPNFDFDAFGAFNGGVFVG